MILFDDIKSFSLIKVMWDDLIGEYEGLRSTDCAWDLSKKCYEATKGGCYLCLSMICGPCLAFCAGIHFACLSFQVVKLCSSFTYINSFFQHL